MKTSTVLVALKRLADAHLELTGKKLGRHYVSPQLYEAIQREWAREVRGSVLPPLPKHGSHYEPVLTVYGVPVWVVMDEN